VGKTPDFSFEKRLWKKGFKVVVGLDEVGRGALAGPLVVGGVAFKKSILPEVKINDSKKLTFLQRERSSKWIKENSLCYSTSQISTNKVDKLGISKATHSGFRRVVKSIENTLGCRVDYLIIDAFYIPYVRGLRMPVKTKRKDRKTGKVRDFLSRQLAIVNGDSRSFSVASASIVAKVHRDKLMTDLGKNARYAKYDWKNNKGYGTKKHKKSIRRYGLTKYHRRTFIKI